jgi:hypothetical protein
VRQIVRAAYGDATGHIFPISAIVGVLAAILLRPAPLRTSLDKAGDISQEAGTAEAEQPERDERALAPARTDAGTR